MSTPDERYNFITRNLQEVLGDANLKAMLNEGKTPKIYWGTATTGRPHVAYLVPMMKLADFLKAGCEVTVLLADLHACLDAMKTPWELIEHRVRFYEAAVRGLLKAIGVPLEKLKFVRGSEYQLSKEYTLDVYRLTSLTSQHDAKKAGAEVVKQSDHPAVSSLLYPLLQALDEEYLHCDAQFGGVDQRKIFTYAEKYLPHMGYAKRIHLMNPMVPGLTGDKMSSSVADSKIDLLDSPDVVRKKLKKAFCEPGNVADNGVLAFAKHVICPLLFDHNEKFTIDRKPENGGDVSFDTYEAIEKDFADEKIHPADLKEALGKYIERFLKPVRASFEADVELQKSLKLAYPDKAKEGAKTGMSSHDEAEMFNTSFDLRIGEVCEMKAHPSAEHLMVAMVQVGSDKPRNAVVPKTLGNLLSTGMKVAYVHNLKPSKFQGHPSEALILSIVNGDDTGVLQVPEGCAVGDRFMALAEPESKFQFLNLHFIFNSLHPQFIADENYDSEVKKYATFPGELNPSKKAGDKKKWAELTAGLRLDDQGVAYFKECILVTRQSGRIGSDKFRSIAIKL